MVSEVNSPTFLGVIRSIKVRIAISRKRHFRSPKRIMESDGGVDGVDGGVDGIGVGGEI